MGLLQAIANALVVSSRNVRVLLSRSAGGNEILASLRAAGAVSVQTAQRFHPQSASQESTFLLLLRDGLIRQPTPGRYYVDEARVEAMKRWRLEEDA